ncbi:MAG: phosphomannomutase/phosphoglucomutase [Candidatus Aenigmarchaeota archaeon]|nr:phosphomannomutase/phosphoglucomutase [Candidatus Aenigmarchaeota archaeon]
MGIFRAYDIRGIYPKELNENLAYRIGLAFGKITRHGTIALGMDARKSGPSLKKSLIKGLLESGLHIIDVGMVPTPVFYFFVSHKKLDGGICITGSHNPKEYNGFKIVGKNGVCLSYETGINKIERLAKDIKSPKLKGKLEKRDIKDEYIQYVADHIKVGRRLKVVIDAGNGIGGIIAPELFRKLGCDVVEVFCEPDGDFPNHHPDPLVAKNLEHLQKKVREVSADIGIAYDGDADRVGFVDEKGNIIPNNHAFALLIENVLKNKPGSKILYEVLSSKLVEDVIRAWKGVPVLSRVGHSYIQQTMFKEGCAIGGETSGHYYFQEMYNNDDGIFASAKMIELVSLGDKCVSEFTRHFPKYFTSNEKRVFCPDEKKFMVIEKLKEKFEREGYKIITIDGVKVIFDDGSWFIIRASNTQPALVVRWESPSKEGFKKIEKFAIKEIKNCESLP